MSSYKDELYNRIKKTYDEEAKYVKTLPPAKTTSTPKATTPVTTPQPIPVNRVNNPQFVSTEKGNRKVVQSSQPKTVQPITAKPTNAQAGLNIVTNQMNQNIENYLKTGTPINRNNTQTYYNPTRELKKPAVQETVNKAIEDQKYAEQHTALGIGKDKKSFIPQALKASLDNTNSSLVNLPRVIGDVFEDLGKKFISPNYVTNSPQSTITTPSKSQVNAARMDYDSFSLPFRERAQESQEILNRMTANSESQQLIAGLAQSAPEMAALAAAAVLAGPVGAAAVGTTMGAELIGGTLASGVVDGTMVNLLGRVIKQYADNPNFWASLITQSGHISEEAKAAGADPYQALMATALAAPVNAAIETSGGIGGAEDDLIKIATKGQLRKAAVKTGVEEGLEEVKQGGMQEWAFQLADIHPKKMFTNELERKLGIPQEGSLIYSDWNSYDANTETEAIVDPNRMAQEFAGGFLMGGAMSLPGHALNYQANKNGPQPIPVNVPGARYEATENGFGTNGRNPLAKENVRVTKRPETKEEIIQEIVDVTENSFTPEELQTIPKKQLKEMLQDYRKVAEAPETPQPIPVNNETNQPEANKPKVNKPGQVNVDVLETDVKRAKERLDFLEYKIDETGSSLLELQAEYREDPTADMKSDPRWASLNKELSEQNKERERLLSEIETKESEISGYYESIDRMAPQPTPYNSPYEGYEPGQVLENGNRLIYKKGSTAQIQQNYDQTGNIREALQGVENKPQNVPYAFDLNNPEERIKYKLTDEKTEKAITFMERVFGKKIMFDNSIKGNGQIDKETGEIRLNPKSIQNKSVTRVVLGHEFTHSLENTKAYEVLTKLVKNYVTSDLMNSYGMDKLREKYASQIEFMNDKAAKQFIKDSLWEEQYNKFREDYADEIADFTEEQKKKYLEQEYVAEMMGEALFTKDHVIDRLFREDYSTFQTVKNWISDTLDKIRNEIALIKNRNNPEARELYELEKFMTNALSLYDKAARQSLKTENTTGTKYSMFGKNSKLADLNKMIEAEERLANGEEPATVWKELGWGRDENDGKMKYEVNDFGARADLNKLAQMGGKAKLSDIFKFDMLYASYEGIGNIKVVYKNMGDFSKNGEYNPKKDVITINRQKITNSFDFKKVLLHEVQHAIQEREGFGKGGNPDVAYKSARDKVNQLILSSDKLKDKYKKLSKKNKNELIDNILRETYNESDLETIKERMYKELAGEAEAFEVKDRSEIRKNTKRRARYPEYFERRDNSERILEAANRILEEGNQTQIPSVQVQKHNLLSNNMNEEAAQDAAFSLPQNKYSKGTGIKAQSEEETNLYNKLKNGSDISLKGKALDNAYEKAVKDGNSDTAKMLVEQAAKNNGYDSPRLYHGSPKFGFTEFDLSAMDDGNSIFTTVNRRVAESYSGETSRSKISEGIKKDFWDMDTDEILSYVNEHIDSGYRKATVEEVNADIDRKMQPVREAANKIDNFLAEKELTAEEEKIIKRIRNSCETFSNTTDNDEAFGLTSRVNDGLFDLMWENEDLKFELMDAMNYSEVSNAMTDLCQIIDTNAENNLFTKDGINLEWEAKFIQELNAKLKPGVYELYGDLDHMLEVDAKGANWNEISTDFDDKFNAIMPYAKTRDICNYARQKGYEGVIIKNVKDSGGAVQGAHVPDDVYVFFYPSKVKSADVETYDDNGKLIPLSERFDYKNKDLRYSKGNSLEANTSEEEKLYSKLAGEAKTKKKFTGKGKKKVEAARNLVAVHNMTGEELAKSLRAGGLPMPSIAIIKAEMGHDMYGPVSIVFDKDSIDPKKNKLNKVYGADAWTPTYPEIDYKTNEKKSSEIYSRLSKLEDLIPERYKRSLYSIKNEPGKILKDYRGEASAIEGLMDNYALKQAYLAETSNAEEVVVDSVEKNIDPATKEQYDYIIDKLGIDAIEEWKNLSSIDERRQWAKEGGGQIIKEAYGDFFRERFNFADETIERVLAADKPVKWYTMAKNISKYLETGGKEIEETENYEKTEQNIDNKIDKEAYREWLKGLIGGLQEKEGIYNGQDPFTASGNRRSWEALHWEHNLENVVKAMRMKENGETIFGSNFKAVASRMYNNIDEVRADQDRLKMADESEFEEINNAFAGRFEEIVNVFADNGRNYDGVDAWQHMDEVRSTLTDSIRGKLTKSGMKQKLKADADRYKTIKYVEDAADDLYDLVMDIQSMPTGYFEAKPERAIYMTEAAAVIVPSDINPEIVQQLEDNGTEVYKYEPGNEEQRRNILNSLDALKFRKAEGITADTDEEAKLYDKLKNYDPEKKWWTTINKPQTIPYNRPTENVAPEEEDRITAEIIEDSKNLNETENYEERERLIQQAISELNGAKAPESVATTPKTVPETRRAQDYTRRSEKQFMNQLRDDLHINRWANSKQLKAYTDEIVDKLKTGSLTEADKNRLFMDILAEGEILNQNKVDEYDDLVTDLKGTTFYVSRETSRNITDYNDFRHNSKLKLSNKGGSHIDDIYNNLLQPKYGKGMFPDVNTQEEMLEQIDNVYKDATDVYTPLSEMPESQLDEVMEEYRAKFDKGIDALEREVNIAKRYNTFRTGKTVKEVSDDYENLNKYKRAAEKVKQNVILTDEDRADLELLHKGSITEAQLRRRSENADNILRVYEAEKPVRAIQQKIKETGEKTHAMYFDKAEEALKTSDFWKSAKSGLKLFTDTAERNVRMIAGKDSQKVIDEYFTPVHTNEANSNRMKNDYRNVVRGLNIDTEERYDITDMPFDAPGLNEMRQEKLDKKKRLIVSESALVQLYGEGKINEDDLNSISADVEKIQNCVNTMRNLYEQMYEAANEVLILHGYEPIAHRENYFPHFTEDEPDGVLGAMAKALGFNVQLDELPTDISGLTQTFKPGKKWWGNILQRTGDATEYDALKGFDRYIEGAGDVIFHTADIQKLRALENSLRYKYSEKGVQEQLDAIRKDKTLDENQKQKERDELYKRDIRQHGKFAEWIRDYTDTLAGKKSFLDRPFEKLANRAWYSGLKNIENRLAANMVAINPGSWLTNFIPLVQAPEIKNSNIIRGMAATVQSYVKDDGFADRSTFITNRRGSDTLWSTQTDRVVSALASPMELIDSFTSQSITRAKYLQEIQNGKSDYAAMKAADRYAADVIADRSKGAMPLVFEAKNPFTKPLTMFQIEVKNQWSHLFKDIPATEKNVAKVAYVYAKFAIGAYIFNDVYEKLVGRRSALDPISWINDVLKDTTGTKIPNFIDAISALLTDDDDDDENALERFMELFNEGEARSRLQSVIQTGEPAGGGKALENLKSNVVQDIPFVGGLMGGGRIPLMSLADPEKIGKSVAKFGDVMTNDTTLADAMRTAHKNVVVPIATYGVLPAGGGQLKKVIESSYDISKGGSYLTNADGEKELRYAVDDTYMNWLKGLMFGQYALEGGKEYIDSGFKRLNSNATEAYDVLRQSKDISNTEAEKIIKDIVSEKKKEDRVNKLKASDMPLPYKRKVAEILDLTQLNSKDVDYANKQPAPKKTESDYKYQEQVDNLAQIGIPARQAKNLTEKVMQYENPYSQVMTLIDSGNYSEAACEALGISKYGYNEKGMKMVNLAMKNGITPKGYMNRFNAANTDGNSSVKQAEAKAYLDGLSMSRADKKMWWTILTGGADKNNPYK